MRQKSSDGANCGAAVTLRHLSKIFDREYAVNDVSLQVYAGELLTLLGPSGSGKTTILMMIAGFAEPTAGEVLVGDKDVTHYPAHRRNLGVVFQKLALFPHMTAAENIAFPMRMRRLDEVTTRSRTLAVLEAVQLKGLEDRYPHQLSGGQQQRVALARAIVFDPPLLLLDEPLSSLDKKLRQDLQREIKALHARLGITIINVTHDQSEALALSDRIAVMRDGRIEQIGSPREIYEKPSNRFVAEFIGDSNMFSGIVRSNTGPYCSLEMKSGLKCVAMADGARDTDTVVDFLVRPEQIALGPEARGLPNHYIGHIEDVSYAGDSVRLSVLLPSGDQLVVLARSGEANGCAADIIGDVSIGWRPEDTTIVPASNRGRGAT